MCSFLFVVLQETFFRVCQIFKLDTRHETYSVIQINHFLAYQSFLHFARLNLITDSKSSPDLSQALERVVPLFNFPVLRMFFVANEQRILRLNLWSSRFATGQATKIVYFHTSWRNLVRLRVTLLGFECWQCWWCLSF